MAPSKLVLYLSLLLTPIIFVNITSANSAVLHSDDDIVSLAENADLQLHQLNSKVSSLETSTGDQIGELERNDISIRQLEEVIEERSNSLASLESLLRSLQEEGSLDVQDWIRGIDTRVNELEKQILNLKKDTETQNKKKDELEALVKVAEKQIEGLNLKFENLRRINDEQDLIVHNAQRALQVAEEEMLKNKLQASSMTKQSPQVNQGWLPPWLSAHLVHFQVLSFWNEHGRPALGLTIQKVLEQKSKLEKWMELNFETLRTESFATIKEHSIVFLDDFQALVQSFSSQAIGYYHVAQSTVEPHLIKIHETVDPYFQEKKMFLKPYYDQVSEIAKPHMDKARLFLRPYTKKMIRYHRKITKYIRIYHSLVQANLHETLSSYEVTKPLVTQGLVQFMASGLMALPVIILFRTLLGKEPKKRQRSTNRGHARRRTKRVDPDK